MMKASLSNHRLQAKVQFSPMPYEVDFTGFLSNTVAPCWLERMRLQLIADHFSDQFLFDKRQLSVIARSEIDYLRPVRMGMQVIGQAWVERCLRTSWTICFMFQEVETDLLCIRAKQIGVFIDPDTLNPTRVPPAIVARVANTNQQ